ncbi:hypothetical protein C0J52_07182 [Blattella germanica]|nr:hypothetical protein C0J52_07182 [Blattella germanica]
MQLIPRNFNMTDLASTNLIAAYRKYGIAVIIIITVVYTMSYVMVSTPEKPDTFTVKYEEMAEDMDEPSNVSVHISENNSIRLGNYEAEPKRGDEHIIFFETSCILDENKATKKNKRGLVLRARSACAIESVARLNPSRRVYLIYSCPILGDIENSSAHVIKLFEYPNVRIWKLNVMEYLKNTPLENWDFMGKMKASAWPLSHSSDVLRYLTLWKYGGTYLDMDFVITKSFDDLESNFVGAQSFDYIASGAMNFRTEGVGQVVAHLCIRYVEKNFDGQIWGRNGPDIKEMTKKECLGFSVLPEDTFYKISYPRNQVLFDANQSDKIMKEVEGSYAVHLWNKYTTSFQVTVGSKQPYALLAEKHCPLVYTNCAKQVEQRPKYDFKSVEQEPVKGENNIIFIETRCVLNVNEVKNTGLILSKRQTCSVESAAKMNPNAKVYVLYTCSINGGLEFSLPHVKQLFSYPNVKIWKLNPLEFVKETPLENWHFMKQMAKSKWPIEHSSDVLRYVALWKYGGTYIDLDENFEWLSTCVMSFAARGVGRNMTDTLMDEIIYDFKGDSWNYNGPDLVTSVYMSVCNTEKIEEVNPWRCHGLKMYSENHFTPIRYPEWHILFRTTDTPTTMKKIKSSYGVHTWNSMSKNYNINLLLKHPFRLLTKEFCPKTFTHIYDSLKHEDKKNNSITCNRIWHFTYLFIPDSVSNYINELNIPYLSDIDEDLKKLLKEPKPGQENIIFIESRCILNAANASSLGLQLNKRQACSIESAAKANPNAIIYLLYSCPINGKIQDSLAYVKQLFTYSNIKLWKIDIPEFLKGTILENWDFKSQVSSSKWPVEHSSDILRFVSLSLQELESNYVTKETDNFIAACVLNFGTNGIGRTVSEMCVEEIYMNFDGQSWAANGPLLITRVMEKFCLTEEVKEMNADKCHQMKVLSPQSFTPIYYTQWKDIFSEAKEEVVKKFESSFGVHLWNSLSKTISTNVLVHTPIRILAEDFCPRVQLHSGMTF